MSWNNGSQIRLFLGIGPHEGVSQRDFEASLATILGRFRELDERRLRALRDVSYNSQNEVDWITYRIKEMRDDLEFLLFKRPPGVRLDTPFVVKTLAQIRKF